MLNNDQEKYRVDLQGLRAIAIGLVVLAHSSFPVFNGGFVGVDVFFVLSGYLITGLLIQEWMRHERVDFVTFYARRLKRLLPALAVMLLVSCGMAIWLLSASEVQAQLKSSPFAALWLSNIYFSVTEIDYFDELSHRDLFLHTWSLAVEEQFYLIWPLFIGGILWILSKIKTPKAYRYNRLFIVFFVAFIASFSLSYYWMGNTPKMAFYLMPSRIWQFSLGGMVSLLLSGFLSFKRPPWSLTQSHLLHRAGLILGLLMIIGAGGLLHERIAYPGLWALVPSFGAIFIILAGHSPAQRDYLSHPALVWLGDRSYSLYLWHWPVFTLGFSLGYADQYLPMLVMIGLALVLAMLSFRFIELPFWKGCLSQVRSSKVILYAVFCLLFLSLFLYQALPVPTQDESKQDITLQWRQDMPHIYSMGCDTWYQDAEVKPCIFGSNQAEKTLVFIGDSVAAQWFSMLPIVFPRPQWRIVLLTKSSCPWVDEDYFYPRIGRVFERCKQWRNAVIEQLGSFSPDLVIMGNTTSYDFDKTQVIEGTSRIIEKINLVSNRLYLLAPTPTLGFDGPSCIARQLISTGHMTQEACVAKESFNPEMTHREYLKQIAASFPQVEVLNLNDLVCPQGICRAVSSEKYVVFRDSQHLTNSFVISLIPQIKEKMDILDSRQTKTSDLSNLP